MTITVSTDGSALGNPNGSMGWAWADHPTKDREGHEHTGSCDAGGATNGTNQIGELCAVLMALRAHPGDEPLVIETDSRYAINCSTTWVRGWKKNGWRNSKKEPVKNAEVIKAIDAEIRSRPGSVRFKWVKGHAGDAGNELVDELARTYAEDCRAHVRDGYLPEEGWRALLGSPYARGTDVPMDARMLLDGELDARDYLDGRCMGGPAKDGGTDRRGEDDAKDSPAASASDAARAGRASADADAPSISEARPRKPDRTVAAADAPDGRDTRGAAASTMRAPDGTAPAATPSGARPTLRHSGLHVSGDLEFTPPPNSSPHSHGGPRRVRGYIEVEGLVQPDGTMRLEHAPFLVCRQG